MICPADHARRGIVMFEAGWPNGGTHYRQRPRKLVNMEMYTTDSIPLADDKFIVKAWLVSVSGCRSLDCALSDLRDHAAEDGADAVVGLRVVMATYEGAPPRMVAGNTLARSPMDSAAGAVWAAYGTALRHGLSRGALERMREQLGSMDT